MIVILALLEWIPATIAKRRGCAALFRGAVLAALLVTVIVHVQLSYPQFNAKAWSVGEGPDAFRADVRGDAVNTMLDEIANLVPRDASLAVLPEGVMINYLARRANPTPYINFMPPELIMFDEERILDAFQTHPPDFVIPVHKDTSEYGVPFFGRDCSRDLFDWIRRSYKPIRLVGATPLQDDRFGILLLEASTK